MINHFEDVMEKLCLLLHITSYYKGLPFTLASL